MKILKAIGIAIVKAIGIATLVYMIVMIVLVASTIIRQNLPWPGDYPNSRWVCNGEFGKVELTVGDKPGFYKGTVETSGNVTYVEFVFDNMPRSTFLIQLTEEQYENDKAEPKMSKTVLRGGYRCTKKKFIITSHYYDSIFGDEALGGWSEEESPEIKLIFKRVE